MFTLFDVLEFVAAFAGAAFVLPLGFAHFGWPGAIAAGAIGFYAGRIVGRIPFAVLLKVTLFRIKRSDTARLRERLREERILDHFVIAELVTRGEPMEQFWPLILSRLRSRSSDERSMGWHNLRLWFPEAAKRIERFDPRESVKECRIKLEVLDGMAPDSGPSPSHGGPSENL